MRFRLGVLIVTSLMALALVTRGYPDWSPGRDNSTRDAQVGAAYTLISALVSGRVTAIELHNSEHVSRGHLLFRIEDRPYQLATAIAKAELAIPRERVAALRAVYQHHLAGLAASQEVGLPTAHVLQANAAVV
jgi:membrane fusion protein (multidrug efflux system)